MTTTLSEMLGWSPLCQRLTESEVEQICAISSEVTLPKGEYLFREGDPGDGLFLVFSGSLEIQKAGRTGTLESLAKLSVGAVIGEMSVVTGTRSRSASALALADSALARVSVEKFVALLDTDNVAALKMVHNLAQVMSRRLLLMDAKLVEMTETSKRRDELGELQKGLSGWSY